MLHRAFILRARLVRKCKWKTSMRMQRRRGVNALRDDNVGRLKEEIEVLEKRLAQIGPTATVATKSVDPLLRGAARRTPARLRHNAFPSPAEIGSRSRHSLIASGPLKRLLQRARIGPWWRYVEFATEEQLIAECFGG